MWKDPAEAGLMVFGFAGRLLRMEDDSFFAALIAYLLTTIIGLLVIGAVGAVCLAVLSLF